MSEDAAVCRRFVVKGQVQGVFFRASAREQARQLGLAGWVRNREDGDVEALARGSADSMARFAEWLARGPARAVVSAVSAETVDLPAPAPFEIR